MATSNNNSVDNDVIISLILFICSTKLWLASSNCSNRETETEKSTYEATLSSPLKFTSRSTRRSYHQLSMMEQQDERINSHPQQQQRDRSDSIASVKKYSAEDEARQLSLMDRVAYHDTVLTRETSLDFHPKNSNWNHFEHYHKPLVYPPSPTRRKRATAVKEEHNTQAEEENQDFIWSDPPCCEETNGSSVSLNDADSNDGQPQQYADSALHHSRTMKRQDSQLHFNAGCLPSKLILIRHGQSEGNVDEGLYATKPDNAMRLTELGWDMAKMAGKALRDQLPEGESVHFIVSPYCRTVETFHGIISAWSDPDIEFGHISNRSKRLKEWYTKLTNMGLTWHEDPRIREQDFGNFQDPQMIKKAKEERHKFGSFYYRFPHGESSSDVFDRVSTFLDSLWRSFESGRAQHYVIVAHGVSIRVFLARYFRYSIDQFHMLANPKNCEMVMLAHDGLGRLKLDGRCELELDKKEKKEINGTEGNTNGKQELDALVTGYKKYSRLRTLPPQWVRPRTVRMSYNDI